MDEKLEYAVDSAICTPSPFFSEVIEAPVHRSLTDALYIKALEVGH